MKPYVLKLFLLTLGASAILGLSVNAAAQKEETALAINGEIVKSGCVSRHAQKSDVRACTENPAQTGKYVFYDPQTNEVYAIRDQSKAAQFAGQNVTVAGYINTVTQKLDIDDILPAT